MSLRICILASGSSGNCTYIASKTTGILVDAGLSAREVQKRLEGLAVPLAAISAVCVSHEHADHTAGLRILNRKFGVALYANAGTIDALRHDDDLKALPWRVFTTGQSFQVGDLAVEPFSVSHDAYDPVGFAVSCGEARIAVVTDIGAPTALVRERLKRCHALVLESNHDERLLKEASRPWSLKQRIMGRQGHLSNERAGALLAEVASPALSRVFLAHLSKECNSPDLARKTVHDLLLKHGHDHVTISLTYPDKVSDVWQHNAFDTAPSAVVSVPV